MNHPVNTLASTEHPYTTLISVENLAQYLNRTDADLVVLDCRHDLAAPEAGRAAFAAGHLPRASFIHLDQDLSGPAHHADGSFAGRHPLPERQALIAALRSHGVNDTTQVVGYDASGGIFAARLWWLLRWLGHDRVAVLDGGLQAWVAAGQPLASDTSPSRSEGSINARAPLAHTVSTHDVLQWTAQPETHRSQLVDARAPDRFRGENETLDPVGGHIPGAKNRFFKENLDSDGRFKPGHTLREEWTPVVGELPGAVMQCGSGVTACHNLLALELAGLHGAALYPGSWSEWCADPSRPVSRAAE